MRVDNSHTTTSSAAAAAPTTYDADAVSGRYINHNRNNSNRDGKKHESSSSSFSMHEIPQVLIQESEISIPGTFVVYQGIKGDGMANTIDSHPILFDDDDSSSTSSNDTDDKHDAYTRAATTTTTSRSNKNTKNRTCHHAMDDSQSFVVINKEEYQQEYGDLDTIDATHDDIMDPYQSLTMMERNAIQIWNKNRREEELRQRKDWLLVQDASLNPPSTSMPSSSAAAAAAAPRTIAATTSASLRNSYPNIYPHTAITMRTTNPTTAAAIAAAMNNVTSSNTTNSPQNVISTYGWMQSPSSRTNPHSQWWIDASNGQLKVVKRIPEVTSIPGVLLHYGTVGTLSPGTTVVATQLITLDSTTLMEIPKSTAPSKRTIASSISGRNHNNSANSRRNSRRNISPFVSDEYDNDVGDTYPMVYPRGRPGWVQCIEIVSPLQGWVVLSMDGCSYLGPGLPSAFVDPNVWTWRITCSVGAYVRTGLELDATHSVHVETLPYGTMVQVSQKTINAQGLSRLRIRALLEQKHDVDKVEHSSNSACIVSSPSSASSFRVVEGWISEALNPLSGQDGPIAQPIPFPVPALYEVTLATGAVIRSGIELMSSQIGHAPKGSLLTVVRRAYSEFPPDKCVERLQLAGGERGGWISIRLCEDPPNDALIVSFVGLDSSFDPAHPGLFHVQAQLKVEDEEEDDDDDNSDVIHHGAEVTQSNMMLGGSSLEDVRSADLSDVATSTEDSSSPIPSPLFRSNPSSSSQRDNSNTTEGRMLTSATTGASIISPPPVAVKRRRPQRQKKRSSIASRESNYNSGYDEKCVICLVEERNATLVHGDVGHICCCLKCARILKQNGKPCPMCRLTIQMVIQHFYA